MRVSLSTTSVALCVVGLAFGDDAAQRLLGNDDHGHDEDSRVVSPDLDAYIEDLMRQWHVPGVAVSIVDAEKTWAKGYGYAVLNSTPMTPHTLFYTGSTTKSFTAAGISLLIDNASAYNDLSWRTPVSSVLSEFVLSDDWATEHITLEDALSHRTGYPRHDLASAATTAEEMVRNLRNLPMTAEPRAKFQYSNKMFGVMGYLIETLTESWLGDFFREYLWEPMGMNETYFSLKDAKTSELVLANEYYYDPDSAELIQVPHEPWAAEEGAGSIISTVLDYAKYLRIMINEEAPISKEGHRELKTPRSFSAMSKLPFLGPVTYANGWNQGIFEGERTFFHSGQVTMFVSMMIMIPSKQLAVTVMSNTESYLPEMIAYHILYEHLKVPTTKRYDPNEKYKSERKAQHKYLKNCVENIYPLVPDPPLLPTLPLSDHLGEYHDAGYGTLSIHLFCDDSDYTFLGYQGSNAEKCRLRVLGLGGVGFEYLHPAVYLEPKSGNFWVGKQYLEFGGLKHAQTPFSCMRAEFKVGVTGSVTHFGLDVRMEGEDGPLVWFERVRK